MDPDTASFYARNAARLAVDHSLVDPSYFDRLDQAFANATTVLDVGCGTGRDTLHLLNRGKNAVGIDASPEMLAEADALLRRRGFSTSDRLFDGSLPRLEPVADASFDGVLCTGVLMHLPEECIFDAVYGLKRVLRSGGILLVSIPEARPDVDPATRRDGEGRLFTPLPAAKLQLLFERVGFALERSVSSPDGLGREGIHWRTFVFRHLGELRDRPLQLVESILNRDQKVATYKLALFRALAEIAQTQSHVADFRPDGRVGIPNELVAEKWLFYYWPVFAAESLIKQGTSSRGADVAIRPAMEPLIRHYSESGGLSGFYVEWRGGRLKGESLRLARSALSALRSTIWTMPVKHAGGGIFDILQYDRATKAIHMEDSLWRELCLTGNWIQDATVLRWAELTEQINGGAVRASRMIDCLLTVPDAKRNVEDARRYYLAQPDRTCVWTERSIPGDFAVDHAIPFSLWRNNDLWNLLPASVQANGHKSDRLPTYELLQRRRDLIVHCWRGLDESLGERFRREALTLLGRDSLPAASWEPHLFSRFVEAFETTAAQRGAARWEPQGSRASGTRTATVVVPKFAPYPMSEEKIHFGSSMPDVGEPDETAASEDEELVDEFRLLRFDEIGAGAFRTHLPLAASLAAGSPFHGFEAEDLAALEEFDWIEVPPSLARKNRFVVRVAGDSMEPTLKLNDLVVFEYHRTPRSQGQIVVANLPEFGRGNAGTEAIKRIREERDFWVFESDNSVYEPFRVEKEEAVYPILGTMVEVVH